MGSGVLVPKGDVPSGNAMNMSLNIKLISENIWKYHLEISGSSCQGTSSQEEEFPCDQGSQAQSSEGDGSAFKCWGTEDYVWHPDNLGVS